MFLRLACISLLLFPFAGAHAADAPPERDAIIAEVMEISGMNHQIEQLPAMIDAGMQQQARNGMDAAAYATVSGVVNEIHTVQAFGQGIKDSLTQGYDQPQFTALLKLLRSPLAQKMTRLEREAQTPDAMDKMGEYAAGLQKAPPSPARRALIERLDQATNATGSLLNIQLQTTQAMMSAMNPAMPPAQRLSRQQMDDMLWQMQLESKLMAQRFIQTSLLYTYRSLPDQELEQYIALYETKIGKWSVELMNRAVVSTFANLAEKTASRLKEALSKNSGA